MRRLPPGARRWVLLALAAILLLGGGLRFHAAATPDPQLSPDERSYAKLALSLTRGTYGDRETGLKRPLHWPPGAPALFAASRVVDDDPDFPVAYYLQALVATLLIAVCFAIAAVAAGPLAGLIAAALVAFYPPLITLTASLQSEPLGALLVALGVLAATWALRRDGRLRWWALSGALFAAAVLTRTDLLLGPPLVAAVVGLVLWKRPGGALRPALRAAGVLLAAYLLVLAPWTIYVSERAGKFTPVTEGDAAALFVGTYLPGKGTTYGMKRVLGDQVRARNPELRGVENYRLEAQPVLDLIAERRPSLTREAALQAEARENLRRYALGRPVAFAGMMLDKVRRTWFLSSRAGSLQKSKATRVYHVILVSACCLLMLVAIARRRSAVAGICAVLVAYSMLLHAVFVAKPRYNLPLIPLLIVGGVVAGAALLAARRSALARDGEPVGERDEDRVHTLVAGDP
ncbi:MAG TPA: glycosyltransferase family 39 protein [Solirubrobacteraceae bacterium]